VFAPPRFGFSTRPPHPIDDRLATGLPGKFFRPGEQASTKADGLVFEFEVHSEEAFCAERDQRRWQFSLCMGGVDSMRQMRNVFEAILKYGHDEDFAPVEDNGFSPTEAPAGSKEKLDVLAARVLRGEPLWHPEDRPDYSGLTAAVRPRE
jgi:hypothetical protein